MANLRDVYCVLILSSQTTVSGNNRPIIPPHSAFHTTLCQHWFYSEGLPRCHNWLLRVTAMRYCRHWMKMATDTMANKFSDDSILMLVSNAMDDLQQQTLIPDQILYWDCISCSRAAPNPLHMVRTRNSVSKDQKVGGTREAVNSSIDKWSGLRAAVSLNTNACWQHVKVSNPSMV